MCVKTSRPPRAPAAAEYPPDAAKIRETSGWRPVRKLVRDGEHVGAWQNAREK
jgi:hypothetical protein